VVFRLPLLGSRWRLMLDEPIVSDLSGRQVRKLLASRAMGFLARRLPARHRLQRAAVRAFSIATRLRSRGKDAPRSLASRRAEEWDDVYALEDPWNYAGAYEQLKYDRTLDLLPDGPIDRALELGCSEGWFTAKLAPKVDRLSSLDISAVALERARARCARFDNVEFRREDFFEHDLGSDWSLIVCSETLYYLPSKPALRAFVAKVEAALRAGGCFLHAHHTCIDDDPARTGLDTGVPFGGREVGHAFEAAGFIRERSLATPLYHIDLFRKPPAGADAAAAGPTVEAAPGAPLSPELQAAVVWNGAVRTRREVESERRAAHVPVLMYHRIATDGPDALAKWRVSPEAFEHQLRFLRRRGFRSIGVDQWDWRRRSLGYIPGRPVMLTFDDAQADFHHTAWPILKRNGFTAHVFVVTGKVGGYSDWDSGHGAPTPLMDWDQIIDLSRQGVTFGSHLVSHSNPDAMDNRSLYEEAVQSRETLETRLGCEVRTVATPYAVFNPRIERILQQAGYTRAFADDPYRAPLWGAAMRTPRIEIFGGDDIAGFADKLWCAKEPPEPADVP
jgi:peptidoglycan/xylan/chitin deacetylase (PgdA/CDA1 family)